MSPHYTDPTVPVYNCKGRLQAELIKSFLEAQNIPTILSGEALGSIYGFTEGGLGLVQVLVNKADELKARELLLAMQDGAFENEQLAACPTGCEILGPQSKSLDDESLDERKKVLFLCATNTSLSQFAEAIVNNDCWEKWVAFSAGIQPGAEVHPLVMGVLEENGIFHQGEPKPVGEFENALFDLVITLDESTRQACPAWLDSSKREYIGFDDPSTAKGTKAEPLPAFHRAFSLIRATIPHVLENFRSD